VSLIDCGQFKALPRKQRVQLAQLVLAVNEYQQQLAEAEADLVQVKSKLAGLVRDFGVTFLEEGGDDKAKNNDDLACAVALFLFGDTDLGELPGGYSTNELSAESPIKQVASFPQELVLMGRATVLLKGIAKRLDIPLSLAERWSDGCQLTVNASSQPTLPLWSKSIVTEGAGATQDGVSEGGTSREKTKIRFRDVASLFKNYAKGKGRRLAERTSRKIPPKLKSQVLQYVVERQERMEQRQKNNNKGP